MRAANTRPVRLPEDIAMRVLYDNPASVAVRDRSALRPGYLALNPNGVVPTLVDDGTVIVESRVIVEYLDDRMPEPPLRPSGARGRSRRDCVPHDLEDPRDG